MEKALRVAGEDLGTVRPGRAAPAMLERIVCSVYNGTTKLMIKELATVGAVDVGTLVVTPFDQTIIEEISKGINAANIGLTANVDAAVIRVKVPALSEERRQQLVKLISQKIESGRVMVRQIRHDVMAKIKRAFEVKEIHEDEKFRLEKEIQKMTNEMMEKIEKMRERKEKELLEI